MSQNCIRSRRVSSALIIGFLSISIATTRSTVASADDSSSTTKKMCIESYEEGQRLRQGGKLRSSREQLLRCAAENCPTVITRDCTEWLVELDQSMPTVVLEAYDARGADLVDVKVWIDGTLVAEHLDGKAISLDPGPHTLRFELAGQPSKNERLVARQGEKNRKVSVAFESVRQGEANDSAASAPLSSGSKSGSTDAATHGSRSRVSPAVYILGGVGLAGLASFATFALVGTVEKGALDSKACKPNCESSDVDTIKRNFLIADISLGVGIGSLAVGGLVYLLRIENASTAASKAARHSYSIAINPLSSGGAIAGINGNF